MYPVGGGFWGSCTIGLIAPASGPSAEDVRLALSANHCFDSAGLDLNNAEFFFDYHTTYCTTNGEHCQVGTPGIKVVGATLLVQGTDGDYALLQLNSIFAGALFHGFTTDPQPQPSTFYRISRKSVIV